MEFRKSWLYSWLMLMMIHILMVGQTQGYCIEEERKALLEIKSSYMKSDSKIDHFLPTWADYGNSTPADGGGDCCDWERVICNTTTGHVTELSLYKLRRVIDDKPWPLNVSLFVHFKELKSLDLSHNYLDKEITKTGLERLSSLNKLEVLYLSWNDDIDNDILPSMRTLTSLKILDLSHTSLHGNFPINDLSHHTKLVELDLSFTHLSNAPNIQDCKSLSRLKRLESIGLSYTSFNKSIISCLSALPSLKILHLSNSPSLGSSFPVQEFQDLTNLEVLLLRFNSFSGKLPIEAFSSFHRLEVLDLSHNNFYGSVPSAIHALSSVRSLSFAYNELNGSLEDTGFCELKNLQEFDLKHNMFDGTLPQCLNNLSFLRMFDISSNRFSGMFLPSLVANLTSLKYIDFSHNNFGGSFPFGSFFNHTELEVVRFASDGNIFEVETEEPMDWIPMFQLQILELSHCNLKMPKGRVVPGFLLNQHKLRELHLSHNSLEGHFPNWLMKNNTNLEVLVLRNNSFVGMPMYRNANLKWLDVSGNGMIGTIPDHIPKFFPNIIHLNLSMNALSGDIPSSIGELSKLWILDLSHNELSGEVPMGLLMNISSLELLKLSENNLHGQVLSGNLSWGNLRGVYLDGNHFTGNTGIMIKENPGSLIAVDISNNLFTGMIPDWIGNMSSLTELVLRNNSLEGRFPCGIAEFTFLDISQNSFSGPVPSCSNFQYLRHLHLGSNRFTGFIPNSFRNMTKILTLDISNSDLSGRIPEFLSELTNLRILLLRKNNFKGSIPKQLCQLRNVSLLDLSSNSLSGEIPSCLQNITGPSDLAFLHRVIYGISMYSSYRYKGNLWEYSGSINLDGEALEIADEVQYTTKRLFLSYKGGILDYMSGLDLSYNKLIGEIPEELGLLTHLRALNLSHNQLTGPIPVSFSNLAYIESLDLSSNGLTGGVPSDLIKLNSLSTFYVSHNNLSGRLPPFTAQFGTFHEASYEGNPLLCGEPLKKKCTTTDLQVIINHLSEGDTEKWYHIDMESFYVSSSSTCVVIVLGFAALLYTNPAWSKRWLDWVEDCMYACYYFLYDSVTKPYMRFCK